MQIFNLLDTSLNAFDQTIDLYLQKAFASINKKLSSTSVYSVVFKGIKGIMTNMMFYIEDALNEQNIYTASRKKSIYSLSKLSGYEPFYGAPASGTLIARLQLNNGIPNKTSKVIIYNNTKISNIYSNVVYSLILPSNKFIFDVTDPLFIKEFKIVQGYYETASYIAKGLSMETVHISSMELFDINTISVSVDGEEYERVGTLYEMSDRANQYIINIGYENAFDVIFGNGEYGKKLNPGQTIIVKYLKHTGTIGNIDVNDNAEFRFDESGFDIFGNPIDLNNYIKLSSKNVISGGLNADTIEFIRANIGQNSRSSVIVSEDNFKLFLKRFSFIGYNNIYVNSSTMDVYCVAIRNLEHLVKSINYYENLTPNDFLLYNEEMEMVKQTLYNSKKMFSGLTFDFVQPIFRRYAILCYVKCENNYEHSIITTKIKKALYDYFLTSIANTLFISKSDIIKLLVDNVSEIESLDITIISEYEEQSFENTTYDVIETNSKSVYQNNNIRYEFKHMLWDDSIRPGLDIFGNILINSKLEMPLLNGPIKYFPYKRDKDKTIEEKRQSININAVEVYFI